LHSWIYAAGKRLSFKTGQQIIGQISAMAFRALTVALAMWGGHDHVAQTQKGIVTTSGLGIREGQRRATWPSSGRSHYEQADRYNSDADPRFHGTDMTASRDDLATSAFHLGQNALSIWDAALQAVKPEDLVHRFLATPPGRALDRELSEAKRILIVGAGKAGAAMSQGIESCLSHYRRKMTGLVNVPVGAVRRLATIRLHAARPAASNQPTYEGMKGAQEILNLVESASKDDIVVCLLSGGASALLPLPVASLSLEDKQRVTLLLHECGATIQEMNAVRKHLSRIKGGQLVRNFRGRSLCSLIISDVIGDPLDVIASGPTAPDPTTFSDALSILGKHDLLPEKGLSIDRKVSGSVRDYLERGAQGQEPETPKDLPPNLANHVIGNNELALAAAESQARALGYAVVNLGSSLDGETRLLGEQLAALAENVRQNHQPVPPPACILCGGETIVTLTPDHGLGGRNQEFVLSSLDHLGRSGANDVAILSGGTDGEDGPTDAAGACADSSTLARARSRRLQAADFLARHDAYHFFEATGDLIKTGLTETNVNDVRLILIGRRT